MLSCPQALLVYKEFIMLYISAGCGGARTMDWDTELDRNCLKSCCPEFMKHELLAIDWPILTKQKLKC